MKRNLYYVLPGETLDDPSQTLESYIQRAEKRGDEVFKIETRDGFVVYERFYHHNTDGTKDIISKSYLQEDELTPKEAVEAMLEGEQLVDFTQSPDVAQYCWNGTNFVSYDSYYHDSEEILTKFIGLRRKVIDEKAEAEREIIRVKEILGFDLDLSGLPMVKRQYGLKGAMSQAISMCEANNWDITEEHVYSVLANLDSDLQGMFS
jgi:hypothetical protein